MSENITRLPDRTGEGRQMALRRIHEIAEGLLQLEAQYADADGQAVAKIFLDQSQKRLRVLKGDVK